MPVIRGSNPTVTDSLAAIMPAPAAIGRPTATACRLVNASVSDNTRRAYAGALGQLDAWLDGCRLDDTALATYLAELYDAGHAASSAATAVAAARFRAKLAGEPSPAGEASARVLADHRRTTADRGLGIESDQVAAARGRVDAVTAGLRRSEVSALRCAGPIRAADRVRSGHWPPAFVEGVPAGAVSAFATEKLEIADGNL